MVTIANNWKVSALALLYSISKVAAEDADFELPAGVMRFPLFRGDIKPNVKLAKRDDGSVSISLKNTVSYFSTVLQIGSDQQNVVVQVDTGSSDLWVMDSSNPYCSSVDGKATNYDVEASLQIPCSSDAMFDHTKSSTFQKNDTAFGINYGDGSFANGTFCYDTVSFGGQTIKDAHFAIADKADSSQDIWGIGLKGSETTVTKINLDGSFSPTYDNLPIQMKQQGLIKANAYSLYLNSLSAQEGSLLFGGVDHSRYTGTLQTLRLLPQYKGAQPNAFYVLMNSLSLYNKKNQVAQVGSGDIPVLLDSGSTLSYVPTKLVYAIAKSIDAKMSQDGYIVMSCNASGGLRFNLGGIEINVDFSQMLFPTNYKQYCIVGLVPTSEGPYILGDSFLRSVYAVYDLDNLEIALAQANFDPSSEQIDVISDSIPSASQASGYSSSPRAYSLDTTVATIYSAAPVSISQGADVEESVTNAGATTAKASKTTAKATTSATATSTSTKSKTSNAGLVAKPSTSIAGVLISILSGLFMLV